MTRLLNTVEQAGELLSLHPQQVRELIWSEQLKWVNAALPGRRAKIRVSTAEIDRFIETRTVSRTSVRRAAAA